MTAPQALEPAWRAIASRFDNLLSYVQTSSALAPHDDIAYRGSLYTSWILIAYAHTEQGIRDLGFASLEIMGAAASAPAQLPSLILENHRRRSLRLLADMSENHQNAEFVSKLSALDGEKWHEHSDLLGLDGNAWPDRVREWLGRVGVDGSQLEWMKEPVENGSETLASLISNLVGERNQLAHGGAPNSIRSSELTAEWIGHASSFVRRCGRTLQSHLADILKIETTLAGSVNPDVPLGKSTIALAESGVLISVGDGMLLRSSEGPTRSCEVTSLQQAGHVLNQAPAGTRHLAVTLNRPVRDCSLHLAI